MYKRLHRLVGGFVGLFDRGFVCKLLYLGNLFIRAVFFELLRFCVLISIAHVEQRHQALVLKLAHILPYEICCVFDTVQKLKRARNVVAVAVCKCLFNALSHVIIKLRHRLSAVLVVLIGLNRYACQSGVARYIVRRSQMSVAG